MKWKVVFVVGIGSFLSGFAEIGINKMMESNVRAYPDIAAIEDDPDWIELHNAGAQKEKENLHKGVLTRQRG